MFKDNIWYPRETHGEKARFGTRAEFLRSTRPQERWKKGLPLKQRDTIFPEDVERLGKLRAEVVVTHEAPLPHRYGFAALNHLADRMGTRLLVHGHHHTSKEYTTTLPSGRMLHVRSLAKAEPWVLEMPT